MNRRKFLRLSGAAGGLAVFGGGAEYVIVDHYRGWIRDILHKGLPGYTLEPRSLAVFIDEYFTKKSHATNLRLFAAAEGVLDVKWTLPRGAVENLAAEERKILSDFLLGSDFFQHYPAGPKLVTYSGQTSACRSPFAKF